MGSRGFFSSAAASLLVFRRPSPFCGTPIRQSIKYTVHLTLSISLSSAELDVPHLFPLNEVMMT